MIGTKDQFQPESFLAREGAVLCQLGGVNTSAGGGITAHVECLQYGMALVSSRGDK